MSAGAADALAGRGLRCRRAERTNQPGGGEVGRAAPRPAPGG